MDTTDPLSPGRGEPDRARDSDGPLPDRVGRFRVLDRIGSGGMGLVLSAYDDELDRPVAVKLLRRKRRKEGSLGSARMLREAQAMAQLSHPNVAQVYETGEHEGQVFIAMELVEGVTLMDWVEGGGRPWRDVVKVLSSAGRGLHAAHKAGIVHRDFKPENVLVSERDGELRVVVVDFGLARAHERGDSGETEPETLREREPGAPEAVEASASASLISSLVTRDDVVMGTPAYMSPEQIMGEPATPRSDQFSFCATLYDALYDVLPFPAGTRKDILRRIRDQDLEAPRREGPPEWLRAVVVRGLAWSPDERWSSVRELLAQLARDPIARRNRIAAWSSAGAITIALAAIGGYQLANREPAQAPPSVCAGGGEEMAQVWGDARAERVEGVFRNAAGDLAAQTWPRVRPRLDAYADAWVRGHRDACEATRVDGEQSEELLDNRMACLHGAIVQLDEILRVFEQATNETVVGAVRAVDALPSIDACADVEHVRGGLRPPADATQAERVEALRLRLARAEALRTAGRYEDGLALAQELRRSAEALGYAPLTVEVMLELGRLQGRAGDYQSAVRSLERAYEDARKVTNARVAATAATMLVDIEGRHRAKLEAANAWERIASVEVEMVGDPRLQADLAYNRGRVAQAKGESEQALAHYTRARDDYRSLGPSGHAAEGMVLISIGNLRLDGGKHEDARAAYDEALALLRDTLGETHPDLAEVHQSVGFAFETTGDRPAALEAHTKALQLRQRGLGEDHPRVADSYNNLGNVHLYMESYDEAEAHYRRALEITSAALGPEHPDLAIYLGNLGNALLAQDKLEPALEYVQRGLEIRIAARGPDHPRLAWTYAIISDAEVRLGRFADARSSAERGLSVAKLGASPPVLVGSLEFVLARALYEDPISRTRASSVLEDARKHLTEAGPPGESTMAELDKWAKAVGL